jgi:hypothetical protein
VKCMPADRAATAERVAVLAFPAFVIAIPRVRGLSGSTSTAIARGRSTTATHSVSNADLTSPTWVLVSPPLCAHSEAQNGGLQHGRRRLSPGARAAWAWYESAACGGRRLPQRAEEAVLDSESLRYSRCHGCVVAWRSRRTGCFPQRPQVRW